jgi:hypothetical protein
MNAENSLLTDEEHAELTSAFNAFTRSGTVPHRFQSEEMYQLFEEFTLALTFPSAVDCGEIGSKKRATLTLLSGWWHGFQTFQTQTQIELLGAILSATVGDLEEDAATNSEVELEDSPLSEQ